MRLIASLSSAVLLSAAACAFSQQPAPALQGLTQAAIAALAEAPRATTMPALPQQTQAKPPKGGDENYVLGPDDEITVSVWKEQQLSGPARVRPDGKISLPLAGDQQAAGLTPMQLAGEITESLRKFINDPTVSVAVTAFNSRKIFFLGEVLHPGPMLLGKEMSVLQAISAAGGLTPYAKKSGIYILRGDTGKQKKIPFDYKKALKTGDEHGLLLIPGDTVVVP